MLVLGCWGVGVGVVGIVDVFKMFYDNMVLLFVFLVLVAGVGICVGVGADGVGLDVGIVVMVGALK